MGRRVTKQCVNYAGLGIEVQVSINLADSTFGQNTNPAGREEIAVDRLRRTADLSAESLRLVTLRYQAGESTALEVVDAQNTLVQARNAYDDSQNRYRVALATLQTLSGTF